ncbi:MAG: ATP-binding cassette domain-containing protein, partial [Candidatus Stygibacter frigidus]|nr:ATP-binding cassette domain-containing protein [Candidatus Stygibacter frigidus]
PMTEGEARNILAKFLFRGDDVFKKIAVLSGGEKVRLRICFLMHSNLNLLMLDEPTNHLDIESREMIEEALEEFKGSILFISHDRYFINKIAHSIVALENYSLKRYEGNYDYYRHKIKQKNNQQIQKPMTAAKPKTRTNRKVNPILLDQLEKEIEKMELKKQDIVSEMEMHSTDYQKLMELQLITEECDIHLEKLLQRWEELLKT